MLTPRAVGTVCTSSGAQIRPGIGGGCRLNTGRQRGQGTGHESLPVGAPVIPVQTGALDAKRRLLMPGHPLLPTPLLHGPVAGVGPGAAVFLMTVQHHVTKPVLQTRQHGDGLPFHHPQRQPQPGQLAAQIPQAFRHKTPLPQAGVRLLPIRRLQDIQRQHRAFPAGSGQRAVIVCAQVALEPDHLHRHASFRSAAGSGSMAAG